MHRIASLILGLCLAAAPFAQAEEWSKTFTLTGKPDLRVTTSDANIRVDTWDQNTIEARVTAEGWTKARLANVASRLCNIRAATRLSWKFDFRITFVSSVFTCRTTV